MLAIESMRRGELQVMGNASNGTIRSVAIVITSIVCAFQMTRDRVS